MKIVGTFKVREVDYVTVMKRKEYDSLVWMKNKHTKNLAA